MSLVKIVAQKATFDELVDMLAGMEKENRRLASAIEWALGENGDFAPEPEQEEGKPRKKYWWRCELRERAGL